MTGRRRTRVAIAGRCARPRAHGAILLEIVLALGLFVATAMTLLTVVSGSIDGLRRSRAQLAGADHARNALAMIEAGLARPETLNGPVQAWSGSDEAGLDGFGAGDSGFGTGFAGVGGIGGLPESAGAGGVGGGFEMDAGWMSAFGVDTGWALEIETEPAEAPGLTLVIVRAYETDPAGGEREGGASVTLRQILTLSGEDGAGGGDPFSGFDAGMGGMP